MTDRPPWYCEERQPVDRFFDAGPTVAAEQVHRSPSGRYRLTVDEYADVDYTRGRVFAGDRVLADVRRDDGLFDFAWAEAHPNGHDYLLCGEAYEVQTVIELDAARRTDFVPDDARQGNAFHAVAWHPSPDGRFVVVHGCYWACPYEVVMCRFDEPTALPWPELGRAGDVDQVEGWTADGRFAYTTTTGVLRDPAATGPMNHAERFAGVRHRRWGWHPDSAPVVTDEWFVPTDR